MTRGRGHWPRPLRVVADWRYAPIPQAAGPPL